MFIIANPGVPYGARVRPILSFQNFAYLFSYIKPLNSFMEAARAPYGTFNFDDKNILYLPFQYIILILVKN